MRDIDAREYDRHLMRATYTTSSKFDKRTAEKRNASLNWDASGKKKRDVDESFNPIRSLDSQWSRGFIGIFSSGKSDQDPLRPSTFYKGTDEPDDGEAHGIPSNFKAKRKEKIVFDKLEKKGLLVSIFKPSTTYAEMQEKYNNLSVVPFFDKENMVMKKTVLSSDPFDVEDVEETYHDAIAGYFINKLRFDPAIDHRGQIPLSPNFAFYVDWFKRKKKSVDESADSDFGDDDTYVQYVIVELSNANHIIEYYKKNKVTEEGMLGQLVQYLHALEVGYRTFGLILNDGHVRNVMIHKLKQSKDMENTYMRFELPLSAKKGRHAIFIPPKAHRGHIVRIIDPGRWRLQVPFHKADARGYTFAKGVGGSSRGPDGKPFTRIYQAKNAINNGGVKGEVIGGKLSEPTINRGHDIRLFSLFFIREVELPDVGANNMKRILLKMTCLDQAVFDPYDSDAVIGVSPALQEVSKNLKQLYDDNVSDGSDRWVEIYDDLARLKNDVYTLFKQWIWTNKKVTRTPLEILTDSSFVSWMIPPVGKSIKSMAVWRDPIPTRGSPMSKMKERHSKFTPLEKKIRT